MHWRHLNWWDSVADIVTHRIHSAKWKLLPRARSIGRRTHCFSVGLRHWRTIGKPNVIANYLNGLCGWENAFIRVFPIRCCSTELQNKSFQKKTRKKSMKNTQKWCNSKWTNERPNKQTCIIVFVVVTIHNGHFVATIGCVRVSVSVIAFRLNGFAYAVTSYNKIQ